MHRAAYYGSYEAIDFCLKFTKLRIDAKDAFGDSPLHAAATNFHVACLRLMIRHPKCAEFAHIYLRQKNKAGQSPLGILRVALENWAQEKQRGTAVAAGVSDAELLDYLYQDTVPPLFGALLGKGKGTE